MKLPQYRIQVKTFSNGMVQYTANVKTFWGWRTISPSGQTGGELYTTHPTRDLAMVDIERHKAWLRAKLVKTENTIIDL